MVSLTVVFFFFFLKVLQSFKLCICIHTLKVSFPKYEDLIINDAILTP